MNKNIIKVAVLTLSAFLALIFYLTYLQVYESGKLLTHPKNRRLQIVENTVARGRILDSKGLVLAETKVLAGNKRRIYPLGQAAANITGYISQIYGKSGLEDTYNNALLGLDNNVSGDDLWRLKLTGLPAKGNDVVLSIDSKLQLLAYKLLGKRKGAVVAVEPSTGRILAMVSTPGFDPSKVDETWTQLREDKNSPLLNRASQGLYPPGSTMKVVTAAGILSSKPETIYRRFDAPGHIVIEGKRIEDRQAVGNLSFTEAFARSSNYVFAKLGIDLGAKTLINMAEKFGLAQKFPFDIPIEEYQLPDPYNMTKLELGETAIGQGKLLVTPLNMAMVAAAVANDGNLMLPRLVDDIRLPDGSVKEKFEPKLLSKSIDKNVAEMIRKIMVSVTQTGTGVQASIPGIKVAGKTGSAQNPHGQSHAWFIGFAPADKPKVAVSVIVENAGAGGQQAAPVAREIMQEVIRQKR